MDPYLLAKWVHILSSTVLFGTGIGTAFQMTHAMSTRDVKVVASVAKAVARADWLFTTPAGIIQPISGLLLIHLQGWSLSEPWLLATYALYTLAFLCWAPVVWLQLQIRDICQHAPTLPTRAILYYRIWFALGWPAFLSLMTIFWLMINKPTFT